MIPSARGMGLTRVQRDKRRRDAMRAAGVCVNGWSHGAAIHGGRCRECWVRKLASERWNIEADEIATEVLP